MNDDMAPDLTGVLRTALEAELARRDRQHSDEILALRAAGKPIGLMELLDQSKWWRTREGEWLTIEHMERSHAHNAAKYLLRHRNAVEFKYSLSESALLGMVNGDMAALSLEAELDRESAERAADVEGWLRSTPCWQALAARGGVS